jgi:methyl-accepting chemotaxis protein
MSALKNMQIKSKLFLLIGVSLVGTLVLGVFAYFALDTVRIGGAMDRQIQTNNDVNADFVPPDLNILESRILVYQLIQFRGDEQGRRGLVRQLAEKRKAYDNTFQELTPRLSEGKLKELITGKAHQQVTEYYDMVEQDLIPALERNDQQKTEQTIPALKLKYEALAATVDQVIQLAVEQNKSAVVQANSIISNRVFIMVSLVVVMAVMISILGLIIARSIGRGVNGMVAMIEQLAANNLAIGDMEITSQDEMGKAGVALNLMKNNLHQAIQSIAETAQHVASASEQLSSASQQITSNSEETSAQANVVTQATKKVSENLQSVSTGSEEMTSTIQSIAGNAHEAATVASKAVETAQAANATVAKLGESSAEIGAVIKVITSIAQQTNLLALNATIEAARAGEAGKGFAVVANEVKELAKQTAKATEDISQKITAIQQDTKGAVDAIGSITGVITQVNEISGTIATAVEEQSATTNEMTRNVADAAKGAGEISHNIEGVAQAAQGTSNSAQESQKAANELAQMAEQLRGLVGQFKIDSAAAGRGSVPSTLGRPKSMAAGAGR